MKALRLAILALARDGKSGELRVLLLALLVAVSALTAVGFFTSRVSLAVDQQAGEVLAADLRLQSRTAIDREYLRLATEAGLQTAELSNFPSVVYKGEDSALTAIRAVSEGYPLRGRVKVADVPFGPAQETRAIPGAGEAWLEARLFAQLGAKVGDKIRVGSTELTATRVLDYRPDQGSQFVDLAPTLLMRLDDVAATGLAQQGSRISHFALFAGEPPAIAAFKERLTAMKKPGQRIVDVADASPQIRSAVDRAGRFLNLAALVTILLAAIAVAISARRYVARHLDTVALMKSMGAPQRLVLSISVLELLMIGLIAGVVGAVIGYAAQEGIGLSAEGSGARRIATAFVERGLARHHDVGADSDRLRAAAVVTAATCAARASVAPKSGATTAALFDCVRYGVGCIDCAVGLAGSRYPAVAVCFRRHVCDVRGVDACGLVAGAQLEWLARQRRRFLALRHGEHRASRARQRDSDRRVRLGLDGVVAARGRAQ